MSNKSGVEFNCTQNFIMDYFKPESPYKGILAWHSVGTGKTCTGIATASSSFEKEGYTILWVTRTTLKDMSSLPVQIQYYQAHPIDTAVSSSE